MHQNRGINRTFVPIIVRVGLTLPVFPSVYYQHRIIRHTTPGQNRYAMTFQELNLIEPLKRAVAEKGGKGSSSDSDDDSGSRDPMFEQAVECVIEAGQASTSLLQRRCKLGYARAARIMDEMEMRGIIGPHEGAKPRAVLISRQQWLEMQMNQPEE